MDVVIGTLEMTCDFQTEAVPWTSKLILVDEAAQATEPMTLIPFKLAGADTHVVLIGDHMQLAPTVLSAEAAFDGLGTSLFERLHRVGGVDPCTLTVQYRMHESIWSWPSREFYMGSCFMIRQFALVIESNVSHGLRAPRSLFSILKVRR